MITFEITNQNRNKSLLEIKKYTFEGNEVAPIRLPLFHEKLGKLENTCIKKSNSVCAPQRQPRPAWSKSLGKSASRRG